jgi:hypothetical protein
MFASFLQRSLTILRSEHPSGYLHMAALLGQREVWLEVGEDRAILCGDGTLIRARPRGQRAAAHARAAPAVLAAILSGELLLDEALVSEHIVLTGHLDDLVSLYEALQAYFNVAVRCVSFAPLLDEFLDHLTAGTGESRRP